MLTIKDFKLGRIYFPTIEEGLSEQLGDALESVGAGLAAGERRPRAVELQIPVRASSSELNPYLDGERMRRQVRSLLENAQARLSGLYMAIAFDSELNGWLLIGGGKLEYDQGGVTLADYKLTLTDAYLVGQRRSSRPGLRVEAKDRRLATTARDYEGLIYSSAFASSPSVGQFWLPAGFTDLRARAIGSMALGTAVATQDGGSATPVRSLTQGDVLHFEQPEASMGLGDVVIYDRRGNLAPAALMLSEEPQAAYGWEEVYGPDYPYLAGDVPVLSNGVCRVRYLTEPRPCFAVDQFTENRWVERMRIGPAAGPSGYATSLLSTVVKEWTPERAVIFARFQTSNSVPVDLYLTLQRGWSAPKAEAYVRPGGYSSEMLAYVIAQFATPGAVCAVSPKGIKWAEEGWTGSYVFGETDEPWIEVFAAEAGWPGINFINLQPASAIFGEGTAFYYPGARKILWVAGTATGGGSETLKNRTGWSGAQMSIGGEATHYSEAEAIKGANGTEVTDGTASGGKAVESAATAEASAIALSEPTVATLGLVTGTNYQAWARVKVGTAGGVGSIRQRYGGTLGELFTFNNTAWAWISLGKLTRAEALVWQLRLWRSSGTGVVFVDRVILAPYNDAGFDGVGDIAQWAMTDTRPYPELVSR